MYDLCVCGQRMEGRSFRKSELELRLLDSMERLMSTQKIRLNTKDDTVSGTVAVDTSVN